MERCMADLDMVRAMEQDTVQDLFQLQDTEAHTAVDTAIMDMVLAAVSRCQVDTNSVNSKT